jgi:hypothetical protein
LGGNRFGDDAGDVAVEQGRLKPPRSGCQSLGVDQEIIGDRPLAIN